jgi:hypothetical protein
MNLSESAKKLKETVLASRVNRDRPRGLFLKNPQGEIRVVGDQGSTADIEPQDQALVVQIRDRQIGEAATQWDDPETHLRVVSSVEYMGRLSKIVREHRRQTQIKLLTRL